MLNSRYIGDLSRFIDAKIVKDGGMDKYLSRKITF